MKTIWMKRVLPTLSAALILTSCGIYTNYQRPDSVRTDGLYGSAEKPGGDTTNLGSLPWRDVFTDVRLQALIERGLRNNTDLGRAHLQVEQAEASLSAANLAFLPSFALAPQATLSGVDGAAPSQTYRLPLTASWQLDVFGSLRNARQRARTLLLASQAYRQAVQAQVVSGIATYYYTLAMLDEQLKISEETAANWQKNVETMRALMAAGRYNDAAVSQSEANWYSVSASVLSLRQQIRETENRLAVLLGDSIHAVERGEMDAWQMPASLSVGLPASLLAQRPDVMRAEQSLAAAFYATNAARAAFYPSITLSGTAGWTSSAGAAITNPSNFIWSAVASLTQPLFQNGRLRAQLRIARAEQESAALTFRQTLLNAGMEVNNALTQVQTYEAKAEYYDKQVASLERAVKATTLLMEHGSATYLEVLTAQQSLLAARLTRLTNRYNEISSVITLYQALGGGAQ